MQLTLKIFEEYQTWHTGSTLLVERSWNLSGGHSWLYLAFSVARSWFFESLLSLPLENGNL